jgi:hypothetical protein
MADNPILVHFVYDHLPPHLRDVSKPICILAKKYAAELPASAELSTGLRKLLEAKDALVRAAVEKAAADPKMNAPAAKHWGGASQYE